MIGIVAGMLSQLGSFLCVVCKLPLSLTHCKVREQTDRELEEQVAIYTKETFKAANRPNINTIRKELKNKSKRAKPTYQRPDFVVTRLARSSLECAVSNLPFVYSIFILFIIRCSC